MSTRAPARPGSRAAGLQVAGLTRMSGCDWPGRLVATVFLQGCPWNCVYCHNSDLIPTRAPGLHAWQDVFEFLTGRLGLLDGVVFSGGEPTRQLALGAAIEAVRGLGFGVGLHTAGAYPSRLAAVAGSVDWIGLDIKAEPDGYADVIRTGGGAAAWRSLDVALASPAGLEVRTTIHPGSAVDVLGLARRLQAAGVRHYALQCARPAGAREEFTADGVGWDERFARLAEAVAGVGFERFEVRSG
ncbi:anaerobic ribonucleoside-triphosphate reductase activating protein [Occultella aeris]|uniref:Pyrroloquinoline quinone biosynthesis protein PqqE n=1 Tax=Occultella aeris TaxID=2761496 RepID=A0A7M4DLE9_9MICO|nr:anaerobic ribonucleoside-triphosphate reductase activating protein [Occultella aeris]VZO38085.1 pyrroloquinoline quinone biosynthesis protein PqqE [Occultella aeris]